MKKFLQLRNLTTRFWILPTLIVVFTSVLALILIQFDQVISEDILREAPWLFSGTPDAARTILSVVAAAAITVVSIAFSITVIAMQQAATQYSTRVLKAFTSDRGNQVVLGVYLATFVYSLLVLRSVRSETMDTDSFVPVVAVTGAIILALLSAAMLIYFINHITSSLRVTTIISRLHRDLLQQIDSLYPKQLEKKAKDSKNAYNMIDKLRKNCTVTKVYSPKAGFIEKIDEGKIGGLNEAAVEWVFVPASVGDFVNEEQLIAEVGSHKKLSEEVKEEYETTLHNAISINSERSSVQDVLFVFRQLVDAALKSLSPGINDPTSAEYSLGYLVDGLQRVGNRELPAPHRQFKDNPTRFIFNRPDWPIFVDRALAQIRNEAQSKLYIMRNLTYKLGDLLNYLPKERKPAIRNQITLLREHVKNGDYIKQDRQDLLKQIDTALSAGSFGK